jgi:hypothetical protein
MKFTNFTPFPALAFESIDQLDKEFHVVVLRGTFSINPNTELSLAEEQQPLVFTDEFFGEVNKSSVRQESDLAPHKPQCDVIIIGSAYAPGLNPAPCFEASIRISGSVKLDKKLSINGPRFWKQSGSDWTLTEPEPFFSLPLQYEHAYGGECRINREDPATEQLDIQFHLTPEQRQQHPEGEEHAPVAHTVYGYNPVGIGFTEQWYIDATKPVKAGLHKDDQEQSKESSIGIIEEISRFLGFTHTPPLQVRKDSVPIQDVYKIPAPQIESPQDPIIEFGKQYTPQGMGVITKAWDQRLKLAGTHDEKWFKEKWPSLPDDFNFAYWNCAHPDMQVPHLNGKEWFDLSNVTPQGTLSFRLPGLLIFMMADYEDNVEELIPVRLDTVTIEPDNMTVSLVWRALIPASPELISLEARMIMKENKTDQDQVLEKMSMLDDHMFKPGYQND